MDLSIPVVGVYVIHELPTPSHALNMTQLQRRQGSTERYRAFRYAGSAGCDIT